MFDPLEQPSVALAARIVAADGGALCRTARALLGWSQDDLAKASGTYRRIVNEHESGGGNAPRHPTPQTAAIARALLEAGVTFDLGPGEGYAVGFVPPSLLGLKAAGLAALSAVEARPEDREGGISWGFLMGVLDAPDAPPRVALWPAGATLAELVDAVPRAIRARPAARLANLRLDPAAVRPDDFDGPPSPIAVGPADRPLFRLVALATVRRRDLGSLALTVR